MTQIPEIQLFDKTLLEVDKALEAKQKLESERHYLGSSIIGHPCMRYLYYYFRHVAEKNISASGIKAIQDGFKQEDIMAERLRFLPYIELFTEHPQGSGNQIHFEVHNGHLQGNLDGVILGILEAPKTYHVWENKAVNEKKFNKLIELRNTKGEKNALFHWDIIYFTQAQIYMLSQKLTRHYLTVQTPGGRSYCSVRTNYDEQYAQAMMEKARLIIFDNWNIPDPISTNSKHPNCHWCEFKEICQDGLIPLVHCKTCRYSEPVENGERKCDFKNKIIPKYELLLDTCSNHVFNPALLSNVKFIEHQADCIIFKTKDDCIVANCRKTGMPELKGEIHAIYTSQDLKNKIQNFNSLNKTIIQMQQNFDGEIIK